MRIIVMSIVIGLFIFSNEFLSAQDLRVIEQEGVIYDYPVYIDADLRQYTRHLIVRFNNNSINELVPETVYRKGDFPSLAYRENSELDRFLNFFDAQFSIEQFQRYYKYGAFGDTLRINKRTGKQVIVNDDSQILLLKLRNPIPLDTLDTLAESFSGVVMYIQGPEAIWVVSTPNDPELTNQWSVPYMDFLPAWGLVGNSSSIKIAITDFFRTSGSIRHEDLQLFSNGGNVIEYSSQRVFISTSSTYIPSFDHGNLVASVAGATFGNNLGMAGHSKNAMILPLESGSDGISAARNFDADIINCSWIQLSYNPTLANQVRDALLEGRIVIAGAGNVYPVPPVIPSVVYPAAFDFGEDGRVIGVTASQLMPHYSNPLYERRYNVYNYSPGINPFTDPQNSFIDLAAPGVSVRVIRFNDANAYQNSGGTSFASPIVSSVAALVLSINSAISPIEMYEILTLSTDDIVLEGEAEDPVNYVNHPDGIRKWNRFSGYGRLNAYKSLKHTIEYYGATLGSGASDVKFPLWDDIAFHEDVYLAGGSTLTIEAHETVTLSAASGTVIIGAPPPSAKVVEDGQGLVREGLPHTDPEPEPRPEQFLLLPNYPNPFNPSTTIRYELPGNSDVRLEVYDMLGRRVALLVNEARQAGTHQAVFDASALSSGVYIYRLQAGGLVQTRKMLLIK